MKRLLFLFFALISFLSCEDKGATLTRAGIASEDFVKARLKYPAEAEFERDIRGESVSDSTFVVYQKFNAKNAFGVRSSYVYKVKMVYLGGDWTDTNNWTYSNLIIEDVGTGEKSIFLSPEDK
jgi:hypothetical protein